MDLASCTTRPDSGSRLATASSWSAAWQLRSVLLRSEASLPPASCRMPLYAEAPAMGTGLQRASFNEAKATRRAAWGGPTTLGTCRLSHCWLPTPGDGQAVRVAPSISLRLAHPHHCRRPDTARRRPRRAPIHALGRGRRCPAQSRTPRTQSNRRHRPTQGCRAPGPGPGRRGRRQRLMPPSAWYCSCLYSCCARRGGARTAHKPLCVYRRTRGDRCPSAGRRGWCVVCGRQQGWLHTQTLLEVLIANAPHGGGERVLTAPSCPTGIRREYTLLGRRSPVENNCPTCTALEGPKGPATSRGAAAIVRHAPPSSTHPHPYTHTTALLPHTTSPGTHASGAGCNRPSVACACARVGGHES